MNKEEFVEILKGVIVKNSIEAVRSMLISPKGRQPKNEILELSNWFNNLADESQKSVLKVIDESVGTSFFSFLCVLDGVTAIEDGHDKGRLILNYENKGNTTWLNNPEGDYLHDLL